MQECLNPLLYRMAPKDQHLQFSKAPIMKNFGELPFGEIPEPLKYVRPFRKPPVLFSYLLIIEMTTLSNGIRVCTEKSNHQTARY